MSGPKSGSYQVVSEAELAARRLSTAEAAARAVKAQAVELAARAAALCAAYGFSDPFVGVGHQPRVDVEAIERWTNAARSVVAKGHAALDREVTRARSQSVTDAIRTMATLLAADCSGPDAERAKPAARASVAPSTSAASASAWRAAAAADAARIAARLDVSCSEEDAFLVAALATAVMEAPSQLGGRQALDLLHNEVSRRNKARRVRGQRLAAINCLLERLDAWNHKATTDAAARLRAEAGSGVLIEQLEREAEVAMAMAARDHDRAIVARTIRHSLQRLGYAVEEGFDTLIAEQGFAHVRRTTWSDHAVRVRLHPDRPEVGLVVLGRQGSENGTRDVEVEREWCGTVTDLLGDLASGGVAVELDRRVDPGVLPVAHVPHDAFPFAEQQRQVIAAEPLSRGMDR